MNPTASVGRVNRESTSQQVLTGQLKLLYTNANLGTVITLLACGLLATLQWRVVNHAAIIGWVIYMCVISTIRYLLARHVERRSFTDRRNLYTIGIALTGAGWGAAGFLLYPPDYLSNQLLLTFVIGGMMLGASSLLAPRPEAFLSFLLPSGLLLAIRLALQGDKAHLVMGLLATVFTVAMLITTRRIYRLVDSSLRLQLANQDLVEDLRQANQETAALNQALELRVEERTAELHKSAQQLRAEIAQREQTEEELLRARKLESLGVLAGGIAHDFNNFLTVVQGNIEVAKARLISGDAAQEFLTQAASACQRAKFLSSQLLTFAKGGAPVRRVVSVAQLVTDAVHLARTGSPLAIELNLAEDLWSAQVDPGQIGQVLHNILINAREAVPANGPILVHASNLAVADQDDGVGPQVSILIQDHGPGIPQQVIGQIFDPYFTTKPGGTGLGLATAYAIVVKHGGRISVESDSEAGTRFTIALPATEAAPPPQPPTASALQTGTERLLVMDDDEALRILFKAVLSQLGYDVWTAGDGVEAIALYETAAVAGKRFDAVLLDLTVTGGMGGVEAAARLKQLDPMLKLIVSSGYSDAPVMSHFADYGFDAVILKPWTVKEMSEVLRLVLLPNVDGDSLTSL